ncbi:CPBP family intramembrane glutamic endopeptidase [Filibacter tadaridae]|uniref:CAAX amino terminal protease self- immunity n=1 Tax=Filibacter tadaridae TaxID=2483811 RepID=A0A3P5WHY1_9BACL|nr:CPBP family intramembrane glutamic endopeptidase [Filibacter tadaridae]VDC21045.1 CAAX amino terminal protease self- immunity [Filibacter tadaridae]
MKRAFGVIYPLLSIILLLWIEQGLDFSYGWKTVAKAFLFLFIPLVLFRAGKFPFIHFRTIDRKSMRIALASGLAIMSVIIGAFVILLPYIDIDALLIDIAEKGVTSTVFPFIAFYILFGNSLMEEFFFRGVLPSLLGASWIRFLLPSFFFAIYHVAIFLPWFSPPLLALAVTGLWIGGFIFQLANERSGTMLPSWTIHMFADVGVLLVGVYIMYFS